MYFRSLWSWPLTQFHHLNQCGKQPFSKNWLKDVEHSWWTFYYSGKLATFNDKPFFDLDLRSRFTDMEVTLFSRCFLFREEYFFLFRIFPGAKLYWLGYKSVVGFKFRAWIKIFRRKHSPSNKTELKYGKCLFVCYTSTKSWRGYICYFSLSVCLSICEQNAD